METKRQHIKTEHTIHPDLTKEQIQLKQERKTMTNTTKFRSNLLFSLRAEKETASHLSIISHKLNKEFGSEEILTAATFNLWMEAAEKNINTNELAIIYLNGREVLILYDLTRHDTGKPLPFLAMKTNNYDGEDSMVQLIPGFPEDEMILKISKIMWTIFRK